MVQFNIKGDEVRVGKQIYVDAPSQASIQSFDETPLSDTLLYQVHHGNNVIAPHSARSVAETITAQDGIVFALRLIETHQCIGYAVLDDIGWQARIADLSITILDDTHFTVEIMQDVLQTVLQFAYWEANLNRIGVHSVEDHTILHQALDATGFSQDGRLRQEAYRDGRYLDILVFSILAEEWSATI